MPVDTPRNPELELDSQLEPSFAKDVDAEKQSNESDQNQAWKPANEAPDGGLTAWLVLVGAWCVLFCTFGWINSMSEEELLR